MPDTSRWKRMGNRTVAKKKYNSLLSFFHLPGLRLHFINNHPYHHNPKWVGFLIRRTLFCYNQSMPPPYLHTGKAWHTLLSQWTRYKMAFLDLMCKFSVALSLLPPMNIYRADSHLIKVTNLYIRVQPSHKFTTLSIGI